MLLRLSADQRFLEADFGVASRTLSWALLGGGFGLHRRVVWHFVRREELCENTDAAQLLAERLHAADYMDAVGLLTARHLAPFAQAECTVGGVTAHAVATVGLGNALRVGDPLSEPEPVGTINLLCKVSVALSDAAMIEALSIMIEARTAALIDCEVQSVVSALRATGTGTDCAVLACAQAAEPQVYAGKHTAVGSAIGASVLEATRAASEGWLREQARVKVDITRKMP